MRSLDHPTFSQIGSRPTPDKESHPPLYMRSIEDKGSSTFMSLMHICTYTPM